MRAWQYFSLKHPGELTCFRMEHRGCNSILLKWDLEQFEPVLSFSCVQVRFMLMQSLIVVCWMWNSRHWIMGFEELSCFWENLWCDCHKSNCDLVWSFLLSLLLSLRFSTNCKLSCDSHFVWVSYAKAYNGNISQDFTHICQNFGLQNFWIMELCMKIWHLILFLLWCLIVAIKFYWEKDRTFRSLGWKCLRFFFLQTDFSRNHVCREQETLVRQPRKKPQSSQDW